MYKYKGTYVITNITKYEKYVRKEKLKFGENSKIKKTEILLFKEKYTMSFPDVIPNKTSTENSIIKELILNKQKMYLLFCQQ